MQAQWNGNVIASSNNIVKVDGNAYFPLEDLDQAYFEPSSHTTECGWKGTASYYNINVDGKVNENAAWFYANPKEAAKGTIRSLYGISLDKNSVHGSVSKENANIEIVFLFPVAGISLKKIFSIFWQNWGVIFATGFFEMQTLPDTMSICLRTFSFACPRLL